MTKKQGPIQLEAITIPGDSALVRTAISGSGSGSGSGGATTGTICAKGTTKSGSQSPFQVYAKIYAPNVTPPDSPIDPATSQLFPGVVQGKIVAPGGPDWRFIREAGGPDNEIPGAVGEAAPTVANNRLAVWTLFSTGWQLETTDFKGITSNTTSCEVSGSGSGGILLGLESRIGAAPARWRLHVRGRAAKETPPEMAALKGTWILQHRGAGVWDTADAGPFRKNLPSWTLTAADGVWRLSMNGMAIYKRDASCWASLGSNVLSLVDTALNRKGIPAKLTVEPAPYA